MLNPMSVRSCAIDAHDAHAGVVSAHASVSSKPPVRTPLADHGRAAPRARRGVRAGEPRALEWNEPADAGLWPATGRKAVTRGVDEDGGGGAGRVGSGGRGAAGASGSTTSAVRSIELAAVNVSGLGGVSAALGCRGVASRCGLTAWPRGGCDAAAIAGAAGADSWAALSRAGGASSSKVTSLP